MACNQTLAGLVNDCSSSMGGIKHVWLADYVDNAAGVDSATTEVTGFTSAATWHKYYFRKNTASMTSTLNIDDANGVNYVSTELALVFSKMDTTKRIEMAALATADVMAVVEDANGVRYFLGEENPVACTAGGGETGTAKGDGNRYTLTLTDENKSYPRIIAASVELNEASNA